MDFKLIKRIKSILIENDLPLQQVTSEDLADELRSTFPREYSRKPRVPFHIAVSKAFQVVLKESGFDGIKEVEKKNEKKTTVLERPKSFHNLNDHLFNNYYKQEEKKKEEKDGKMEKVDEIFFIDKLGNKRFKVDEDENENKPISFEANKNNSDSTKKIAKKNREKTIKTNDLNTSYDVIISDESFSELIGMEDIINKLKIMMRPFFEKVYCLFPRGILISGPSGCGKTLLAKVISNEMKLPMVTVSGVQLMAGLGGEREENINNLFKQATSLQPSFILIESIDQIISKHDSSFSSSSSSIENQVIFNLIKNIDKLNQNGDKVWLILTSNKVEEVEKELMKGERVEKTFILLLPDSKNRIELIEKHINYYKKLFKKKDDEKEEKEEEEEEKEEKEINNIDEKIKKNIFDKENTNKKINFELLLSNCVNLEEISQKTPAFSGLDLKKLVKEALIQNINRISLKNKMVVELKQIDFDEALELVGPSTMVTDYVTIPEVTWEKIGALKKVREELQWLILNPIKYPELMKRSGLSKPEGIMLFGPPGCGKTLVAKAIANEASLNFISVKGPELIDKYVGESEKNVRSLFQRAKESSPCLIFFDEIDSICEKRREGGEGGGTKVVQQLLTELDGVLEREGVYVLGATNRLDCVDPAFLRENRFSSLLYIGLPTAEGRHEILQSLTNRGTLPSLTHDVDLEVIAHDPRCERLNGADLLHLIKTATRISWKNIFTSGQINCMKTVPVNSFHFQEALEQIKPSVSGQDLIKYQKMASIYSKF